MRRALAILIAAGALQAQGVYAQAVRARSGDYLFVTTAHDARSMWVNPAGLAIFNQASIMGEIVADRPVGEGLRLSQWTVGFNSRGFALGYQRDRFATGSGIFRFALGLRFRRGTLGGAYSIYRAGTTDQGGDIGLRYHLLDVLEAGVVLRNIGRPFIHDSLSSLKWVAGLGWIPVPHLVRIAAEARFTGRVGASGYESAYRAGIHLSTRGRLPIGVTGALDLGSRFTIDAFTVGIVVGGIDQVVALGSAVRAPLAAARFDRFSLTGVASREPLGRLP